jgi:hypothetical protein
MPPILGRLLVVHTIYSVNALCIRRETAAFLAKLACVAGPEFGPVFAPPFLVAPAGITLCQTGVIEKHGLCPENAEDEAKADMISACAHDYIAEGRSAFHPGPCLVVWFCSCDYIPFTSVCGCAGCSGQHRQLFFSEGGSCSGCGQVSGPWRSLPALDGLL